MDTGDDDDTAQQQQQPLPLAFLTTRFLETALVGSLSQFEAAMAELRRHHHHHHHHHHQPRPHGHWIEWTPIEFALIEGKTEERRRAEDHESHVARLYREGRGRTAVAEATAAWEADTHALRERIAALIQAMHAHCGVTVRRLPAPWGACPRSVLALAMRLENLPAFEALLMRCGAVFDAADEPPLRLLFQVETAHAMLPFLQLLAQERARLPALPSLDPNVRDPAWSHQTVLQRAICYRTANHALHPAPELVRVLLHGFGADPMVRDDWGRTPLDLLRQIAGWTNPCDFASDAAHRAWAARVAETEALLLEAMARVERLTAVLMGVGGLRLGADSPLRHLDAELARRMLLL